MSVKICSDKCEELVIAARLRSQAHGDDFSEATTKQVQKLVITINEALRNKDNRKKVLQAITALPITSQKQLTFWTHSILIDVLTEEGSREVLREIEDLIEARVDTEAINLFPWYRPQAQMPDLLGADYDG